MARPSTPVLIQGVEPLVNLLARSSSPLLCIGIREVVKIAEALNERRVRTVFDIRQDLQLGAFFDRFYTRLSTHNIHFKTMASRSPRRTGFRFRVTGGSGLRLIGESCDVLCVEGERLHFRALRENS